MRKVHLFVALASLFLLSLTSPTQGQTDFIRGDANNDSSTDLADSAAILGSIYSGFFLDCDDAADANDDGAIDLADSLYLVQYLFNFRAQPPAPGPTTSGPDPTPDALACNGSFAATFRPLINHKLRVETSSGPAETIVDIEITLEIPLDSAEAAGWSLTIVHDPNVVTPIGFSTSSFTADVVLEEITSDTIYTFGAFDLYPPLTGEKIPVGVHNIHTIQYELIGEAGESTALSLVDGSFSPSITIVDGFSYIPDRTHGSITIDPVFIRGDVNQDSMVNVSDAMSLLRQLFVPGYGVNDCAIAGDIDDNQTIDLTDAVHLLTALFVPGSPAISAPHPNCGTDSTTGALDLSNCIDPC